MDALLASFSQIMEPWNFLQVVIGVFLGVVVGAIPGLSASVLIALALPLTFYMEPVAAIVLLVSMYVGGVSGGLISATLLRMPGTPASVVTTLDGYPLAQAGQPALALGLGTIASFGGGLVSWVFLAALSPMMARFAIGLDSFDIFALVLSALVLIAAVGQGSVMKALIAGLLGMLVAVPGIDPVDGSYRLTFGIGAMVGGFGLLPVLIGVFAGSQVLRDLVGDGGKSGMITAEVGSIMLGPRKIARHLVNILRSSVIGTWVGMLPGVGANIGSLMAYGAAKGVSKTPEKFGAGSEEGIVASEAGNNATVGGALIPLVTLGIPGSVVDAILLGALMIHNVAPGPQLFVRYPEVGWAIISAALVANFVMLGLMVFGIRFFAMVLRVPRHFLLPAIAIFCVVGTFAMSNRWFDVGVMLVFSVVGYLLEKAKYPLGPFVIGLVLERIAELHLRAGLMATGGSILPMFSRPVAVIFLLISLVSFAYPFLRPLFTRRAG